MRNWEWLNCCECDWEWAVKKKSSRNWKEKWLFPTEWDWHYDCDWDCKWNALVLPQRQQFYLKKFHSKKTKQIETEKKLILCVRPSYNSRATAYLKRSQPPNTHKKSTIFHIWPANENKAKNRFEIVSSEYCRKRDSERKGGQMERIKRVRYCFRFVSLCLARPLTHAGFVYGILLLLLFSRLRVYLCCEQPSDDDNDKQFQIPTWCKSEFINLFTFASIFICFERNKWKVKMQMNQHAAFI